MAASTCAWCESPIPARLGVIPCAAQYRAGRPGGGSCVPSAAPRRWPGRCAWPTPTRHIRARPSCAPVRLAPAATPPATPAAAPGVPAATRPSAPRSSCPQPVLRALFSKVDTLAVFIARFLPTPLLERRRHAGDRPVTGRSGPDTARSLPTVDSPTERTPWPRRRTAGHRYSSTCASNRPRRPS